jgi:EAL domain-containing protein (putative c-di-GMP-specific phosphodiesterase class I)
VIVRAIALAADEKVGVNLSPASIHDADTRAFILDAVRVARLPADRLVFELTEHAAVQNLATAHAFATELQRLGCRLALDDFGVAFASFAHLKHLPFDAIKIDGSFIRSITSDRTDQVLVQAIVSAARQLGKTTVAEHVSDIASLKLLADMGVDYAQGYYLGAPQPVERSGLRLTAAA